MDNCKQELAAWRQLGPDLGQLIDNLLIIRGTESSEWEKGVRGRLTALNLAQLQADKKELINESDPRANMYGCVPCPKCGSKFRAPFGGQNKEPLRIKCDDCGYVVVATRHRDEP